MTTTEHRPTTAPQSAPVRRPAAGQARRRELAAFLRSRRERLTPGDVGLPPGGRRRTPGLRREEVASLAGVGITWYTWLEQGRDINVSPQVLDAIARTLMLDLHERDHLYILAGSAPPASTRDTQAIAPEVQAMLDKLYPYPAFVTNARFDLLATNRGYRIVVGDVDALPREERNSLWLMFTKRTTARCYVDSDESKPRMVATFRSAMAEHVADPAWKCLLAKLRAASPEFCELWDRHEVAQPENMRKRLLHKQFGLLQFQYVNTWLAPRAGLRLVTYVPADEPTAEAVARFDDVLPTTIS